MKKNKHALGRKSKKKSKSAKNVGQQQANNAAAKSQQKLQHTDTTGTTRSTDQSKGAGSKTTITAPAAAKGTSMPRTRSKSRLAASAALNQISSAASIPSGTGPPKDPWDPRRELPTRGLFNNGNTCFFNAALQNVFKTRLLHQALFANPDRRKGDFVGPMNKALRRVLLEMLGDGAAPAAGRGKSGGKHWATER